MITIIFLSNSLPNICSDSARFFLRSISAYALLFVCSFLEPSVDFALCYRWCHKCHLFTHLWLINYSVIPWRDTDCIRCTGEINQSSMPWKRSKSRHINGTPRHTRENVLIEVAQTQILTHLPTTQSDQCRISLSIDLGSGHFAAWVVFLGHGNGEKGKERDAGTMRDKATAWINLSLVNVREIKTATGAAAGNWDSLATGSAVRREMHLPVATCDACHMLLICNCDENLHMPPTRGFQSFGVLIMKLNVPLKANTLPRSPFATPPRLALLDSWSSKCRVRNN